MTITAVDNDVDAPDKQVTVSATASGGNGVADPAARTLTITDDDAAAWTVEVDPTSIDEDAGTSTVKVSSGTVTFAENQTITLSLTGTATKGADYMIAESSQDVDADRLGGGAVAGDLDRFQREREHHADHRSRFDDRHRDGDDHGGRQRCGRAGQARHRLGHRLGRQWRRGPGGTGP